ncbi:hypothetical protein [Streptomyces sp. NRRL B-3648]|uniref:ATP-dependent DNA ligase n=1 Tax=Streptomyces sp. NRRL B-3648 TaxID=1519493 RepID=UPI001F1F3117|nr:hypothetical protein [Streptomyces sp. NRRL B-3648]
MRGLGRSGLTAISSGASARCVPAGWAAEPKWDGYRAQLAACAGGRVLLRCRQGTDMTASFPENRAVALSQLPTDIGLDGELVVWERDRLAFERLQQRLARRGSGAAEAARQWTAHYVIFDLVHAGADLSGWPYERRRAALEALFRATAWRRRWRCAPRPPTRLWRKAGWSGRRPGWRGCA